MSTQAHARRCDSSRAALEADEEVDCERAVLVVALERLLGLRELPRLGDIRKDRSQTPSEARLPCTCSLGRFLPCHTVVSRTVIRRGPTLMVAQVQISTYGDRLGTLELVKRRGAHNNVSLGRDCDRDSVRRERER